jgi:hypothetical protein
LPPQNGLCFTGLYNVSQFVSEKPFSICGFAVRLAGSKHYMTPDRVGNRVDSFGRFGGFPVRVNPHSGEVVAKPGSKEFAFVQTDWRARRRQHFVHDRRSNLAF